MLKIDVRKVEEIQAGLGLTGAEIERRGGMRIGTYSDVWEAEKRIGSPIIKMRPDTAGRLCRGLGLVDAKGRILLNEIRPD